MTGVFAVFAFKAVINDVAFNAVELAVVKKILPVIVMAPPLTLHWNLMLWLYNVVAIVISLCQLPAASVIEMPVPLTKLTASDVPVDKTCVPLTFQFLQVLAMPGYL